MVAFNGPGRGASVNNTSATTQVSTLIDKFNMKGKSNTNTKGAAGVSNQQEPTPVDGAAALPANANSWATQVENTTMNHDYKLTIFFRKNNTVSNTTLSQAQKGRLIFKRLNVPKGKCLKCDDSKRDRLILTISGQVPTSSLNLIQSFEAKPNLWTKPVAPIVKDKTVFLFWTPEDMDNADILRVLEHRVR